MTAKSSLGGPFVMNDCDGDRKLPIYVDHTYNSSSDEILAGDDLDGSYLGTPTAGAINDTAKVKRSQPFTTQGKPEHEVQENNRAAVSVGQTSSLDDLRKVGHISSI